MSNVNQTGTASLDHTLLTGRIINGALVMGVLLVTGIALVMIMGADKAEPAKEPNDIMRYIAYGFGGMMLVTSLMLRKALMSPSRLASAGPSNPNGFAGALLTGHIITVAVAESAGFLGAVMGIVTKDLVTMAPPVLGCIALMGLYFPSRSIWQNLIEQAEEESARLS